MLPPQHSANSAINQSRLAFLLSELHSAALASSAHADSAGIMINNKQVSTNFNVINSSDLFRINQRKRTVKEQRTINSVICYLT